MPDPNDKKRQTARALDALQHYATDTEAAYLALVAHVAGGMKVNHTDLQYVKSCARFAIEFANAICIELGDRAPDAE